jgi:hypothetical protein
MSSETSKDPLALALAALTATLIDERRAERFLALSGIETDELRARVSDPVLLAAVLTFLEAHEPDLVDVSEAIGVTPQALVAARRELES